MHPVRFTHVHHLRSSNNASHVTTKIQSTVTHTATAVPLASPTSSVVAATGPAPVQVIGFFQLTILFLVFFIFLSTLPRLIARFQQPGAWREGWLLRPRLTALARLRRSVQFISQPIPAVHAFARRPTIKRGLLDESDDGHSQVKRVVRRGNALPPVHVPAWSTLFHPFSGKLSKPIAGSNISVGRGIVYATYAIAFLFVAFVGSSGIDTLKRAGYLVVGQLPLMVLLGSKNSLIAFLIGRSYEKINWIHRWIGRLMFVSALFHVIGFLVMWLKKNTEETQAATHLSAWIALTGFGMIALFSLPIFRRSAYHIFVYAHWVGLIVFLIAIPCHVQEALPFSIATLILFVIDQVFRIVSSHVVTASLSPIPDLKTTRIEISDLARGWRAGQHVRLRALSKEMGWTSWAEVHPFTIASVEQGPTGEGVVLLVKSAGDWTNRLYDIASRTTESEFESEKPHVEKSMITTNVNSAVDPFGDDEKSYYDDTFKTVPLSLPIHQKTKMAMGSGATMKFVVEGPYGGPPSHAVLSSFSSTLIVVGGSGISYGLAVLGSLVSDVEQGSSRTRLIHFVWVVKDPASLIPLARQLADLQERVSYTPGVSLRISVHYTRASTVPALTTSTASLVPGRPNLGRMVNEFVSATDGLSRSRESLTGVAVACCGPEDLMRSVGEAEGDVDPTLRQSVGGVEVFRETFGL